MLQKCVRSIPRIKVTFLHFSPESGSGKRFHASGMRAIDSPHKITPNGSFSKKIFPASDFVLLETHVVQGVSVICKDLRMQYLSIEKIFSHAIFCKIMRNREVFMHIQRNKQIFNFY
jgi:hypothetical protein